MEIKRLYYGFRYYSGHTCTFADSDGVVAGRLELFHVKSDLYDWLAAEKLSAPCGCDGGERVKVSRVQAIALVTRAELEKMREYYFFDLDWKAKEFTTPKGSL